jgi:hypothetical protein
MVTQSILSPLRGMVVDTPPLEWARVLGSGAGLGCWARVLGSGAGLGCWARVLGSGAGLGVCQTTNRGVCGFARGGGIEPPCQNDLPKSHSPNGGVPDPPAKMATAKMATAKMTYPPWGGGHPPQVFGALSEAYSRGLNIKNFSDHHDLCRALWHFLHNATRLFTSSLRAGASRMGMMWWTSCEGSSRPFSQQSWHNGCSALNLSERTLHL